jgi:hypothetical protein
MAISSETSALTFTGNNSTVTAYALTFPFSGASEIVVTHIEEDGTRNTLAITTGYTLTGDTTAGSGTLKTVAAIPVTDSLLVERFTAAVQSLDSSSPAGSYPTSIETQLDRSTRAIQDGKRVASRNLARSLRLPDGELAAELPAASLRAGEVLFFNAATGAVETKTPDQILALSSGAPDGIGIPSGGTAGQALVKTSGTAYAVQWSDVIPTTAQIVTALQSATTTQQSATREAIKAQSRSVGFLNRFGRLSNGTAVATGSTPEIGENVHIHWGSGSANPTVVNEALEAATGTLIYYGANVASPGNRFSITVIAEIRINSGYTSGSTAPDLTLGINSRVWSSVGGLASFLAAPSPIHAQIRTTGEVGGDFYLDPPSVTSDDSTDTFRAIGAGIKFPIILDVDGPNDIVRITVAGRTRVFRDSRYSRCVDETLTGFFVEWESPSSSTQYYWAIHSIAVNAPELQDSRSFEGGEYGRAMHDLMTRDTATLPSRQRVLGGQVQFNADQGVQNANDPYAIAGNPHLGYAPYCRPAPFIQSRLSGLIQRSTAALASAASAADQNIHSISRLEELAGFTGNQLAAGSWMRTTYLIRFGANANTKRLKIVRSAAGATRFDSGNLTDNAAQVTLTFYQIRLTAGYRFVTIMEWSDASSTAAKRIQTYNESAGGAADQLLVTGTTAGDVTIDFHWTEINPQP